MSDFGPKEAAQALSDIDDVVQRVRQSHIYDIASQILIAVGVLVMTGNLANYAAPNHSGFIWITVNVLTIASVAALSVRTPGKNAVQMSDFRMLAVFVMTYAFGLFCTSVLGHFGPRQLGAFWTIYFMLFYCIAGLWFGRAFIAMGLSIIVLTLIGYFFVQGPAFLLWMAAVNGGGLILAGLWMRRI